MKQESADAFQELVDHVQKHLRVLQVMKLSTESWEEVIIYLIEKNLDNATRRRWEEYIEQREEVMTSTMMEFLQRQCQLLRRASLDGEIVNKPRDDICEKDKTNKYRSLNLKSQSKMALSTTTQEKKYYLCQGYHLIYNYEQFLGLSIEDRIKEIKRLKFCLNCLRNDHFSRSCRSGSCRECGERYNTLCHTTKIASDPAADSAREHAGRIVQERHTVFHDGRCAEVVDG